MNFVKHLRKKRINIRRSNIRKKENLQILHADINRLSTYSHSSLSNFLQDNPDRFETFSHSAHLWRHLYHLHETSKLFRSYDNSHDCFSRERNCFVSFSPVVELRSYKKEFPLRVWNCTSRYETMSDDVIKGLEG